MNMGKHVKQNGIFIPQSMAKEYLATSMPIPFSSLQGIINNLFYNQDDSPLNHLRTLGSDDPLLPRARAVDFLNNQKGFDEVHEIGPGNFNFAINSGNFLPMAFLNVSAFSGLNPARSVAIRSACS